MRRTAHIFVSKLKYLGIYLVAANCFEISVDKLFRVFSCSYARFKAPNSEWLRTACRFY